MLPEAPPQPPATIQWHGVHLDPKMIGLFVAAGIIAFILVKAWQALPKWLIVLFVFAAMAMAGFAAFNLGGTHIDKSGVHH